MNICRINDQRISFQRLEDEPNTSAFSTNKNQVREIVVLARNVVVDSR